MQRSRIVQVLNVPQRVRLGPSLAAALLDSIFEHPVEGFLLSKRAYHRTTVVPTLAFSILPGGETIIPSDEPQRPRRVWQ